jgi:cell wall-associated NlpC family hydrolase
MPERPAMPDIPDWVADYVGIPYRTLGRDRGGPAGLAGLDCWGLVRLVYADRLGVDLPAYNGRGFSGRDSVPGVAALVADARHASWREVPEGEAMPSDLVLLRVHGQPVHVGVLVAPRLMLHSLAGHDSAVERLDSLMWSRRVIGYGRWSP